MWHNISHNNKMRIRNIPHSAYRDHICIFLQCDMSGSSPNLKIIHVWVICNQTLANTHFIPNISVIQPANKTDEKRL